MRGNCVRFVAAATCVAAAVSACGAASGTTAAQLSAHRVLPSPSSSSGTHSRICGIRVGYVPSGLTFRSVEGSPERNEVNFRYMGPTGANRPTDPWLFIGAHWGDVMSITQLRRYYPHATVTLVRGKPALLVRIPPRMFVQWNESSGLSATLETTTLSLRQLRQVADHLDLPAQAPADAPGPAEAGATGCAATAK